MVKYRIPPAYAAKFLGNQILILSPGLCWHSGKWEGLWKLKGKRFNVAAISVEHEECKIEFMPLLNAHYLNYLFYKFERIKMSFIPFHTKALFPAPIRNLDRKKISNYYINNLAIYKKKYLNREIWAYLMLKK